MKTLLLATLALAAPATAQAPNWSRGTPIYVTMTDRGFTPRRIMLRRGAPYILHIANRASEGHNLTAKSFFSIARVSPRDRGLVAHDQVSLLSGQRAVIHMLAPDTPSSKYEFRSTVLADATSDYRGAFYVG